MSAKGNIRARSPSRYLLSIKLGLRFLVSQSTRALKHVSMRNTKVLKPAYFYFYSISHALALPSAVCIFLSTSFRRSLPHILTCLLGTSSFAM